MAKCDREKKDALWGTKSTNKIIDRDGVKYLESTV